jgi:hypothetical protein
MKFRFECVKTTGIEENIFDNVEYPSNLKVVHEFEISDDTRWDNVLLTFAKFLDATGYVGVYEKIAERNETEWELFDSYFGVKNEDTSNPGLSD